MNMKPLILDKRYSTTRLCYKLLDDKYLDKNGKIKEEYKFKLNFSDWNINNSKILSKKDEKFDTYLFLPKGKGRKGEGGLRTKGYFKHSINNKPLVTIITVVYNGEKYLEETIKSVISQTYDNVEYIIIDGGSEDNTINIIKKYENYIDYWISEKDCCMYEAINKGLLLSMGNIIGLLNSDDMYYDERVIEDVVNYFNLHSDIDGIYGKIVKLYKNNKQIVKPSFQVNFEILLTSMHSTFMPQPTLFLKKKIYKNLHFDLSYKYASDYDFNLKILQKYNIRFFNRKITIFRQHDESITSSGKLEGDRKKILYYHGLNKINIIKRLFLYYKYWIKYKILDIFND